MGLREIIFVKISWFFLITEKSNPNFTDFETRRIFVLFTMISYKSHASEFCPLSKHVNVPSLTGFSLSREQEKRKCSWCTKCL